jgi:hypothetical protein
MDWAALLRHLAEAKRHVAQGERHLVRQKELIAELRLHGHDVSGANDVLATMQQSQLLHLEALDRIMRELNDCGEAG